MKKLSIEIADTPSRRAMGLMNRKSLGEDEGMLFKFTHNDYLCFWMKNTYIPLSIAFLSDKGKVLQIEEMKPRCTSAVRANYPCKFALEANLGWFMKNDIGVGDVIGGLEISRRGISRLAQMTQQAPPMPPQEFGNYNEPGQSFYHPNEVSPQQGQLDQEQQPDPKAEIALDDRAKVRYAEQHNLALQIVYTSKRSRQTLPPRKLIPVPGEGYTIGFSDGGDYFTAYDSSPTINGGDWQILGNQIKRFLFSNIIALEVLEFVE